MDASTKKVTGAAAAGLFGLCWYAMPDVVRSRTARAGVKTALVAGAAAVLPRLAGPSEHTGSDAFRSTLQLEGSSPTRMGALVAAGTALVAGSIALDVKVERAIFARGERRRAEGLPAAHLRTGLVVGALLFAVEYLDRD